MLRSLGHDMNNEEENALFIKFKGILSQHLARTWGQNLSEWCLRNEIEIITEIDEIAPMEAFILGYRTWERLSGLKGEGRDHVLCVLAKAGLDLDDKIVDFIVRLGDRVPVSDNEEVAYLFPRDFVNKALLFNMMPN
jgi:hypothetical protein